MALITCPECKKQISEYCMSCPNCGFPLTHDQENLSFHDSFYNDKIETHGFHDFFKDTSVQETESKQKEELGNHSFHDSFEPGNLHDAYKVFQVSVPKVQIVNDKDSRDRLRDTGNDILGMGCSIMALPILIIIIIILFLMIFS